jgi:DNA-binding MarR family transcriptional regulator
MKPQKKGGFLIAKIHQLSDRIFNKILKENDLEELSSAQGRILFVLWNQDNISIKELGKKTLLKKSTLTSMLDLLEDTGFVKRVPSKKDRRKINIKLTQKNEEFRKKYIQVSDQMTKIYYNNFSEKEIEIFENYLTQILSNLTEFEKKNNN